MKLLVLSNGQGEDYIALSIVKRFLLKLASLEISLKEKLRGELSLKLAPLVGEGGAYQSLFNLPELKALEEELGLKVDLLSFEYQVHSSGVKGNPLERTLRDLFGGGLVKVIRERVKTLKAVSRSSSGERLLSLAVGDVYPLAMATLFLKLPTVFVGTAKSVKVEPYNLFERSLMKRCLKVFVRDEATMRFLRERGLEQAEYVGNPMLEPLEPLEELRYPEEPIIEWLSSGDLKVALLPGRVHEFLENLELQLEALKMVLDSGKPLRGVIVIPEHYGLSSAWGLIDELELRDHVKVLTSEFLGDVLKLSDIVLGQAGTANEQAAALGKPIVAFKKGKRLSWYRWRQLKLLGEAVRVVEPDPRAISRAVLEILENPEIYQRMSLAGKEAMGEPGGATRIAETLLKILNESKS